MPTPGERSKNKKFRKTISKTKIKFFRGKTGKKKCGLCKNILSGVPHGKSKTKVKALAKSKRRPSVVFGGVLCNKCRNLVFEEGIKIKHGLKDINGVEIKLRKYVKDIIKLIEI